jgi:hypothetical protein
MTDIRRINLFMWAGAMLLGAVFAYAAWPKIADPSLFGQSIHRYALLPNSSVSLLAIYLPWLEICAAVFVLTLPRARRNAHCGHVGGVSGGAGLRTCPRPRHFMRLFFRIRRRG